MILLLLLPFAVQQDIVASGLLPFFGWRRLYNMVVVVHRDHHENNNFHKKQQRRRQLAAEI
jgi:hypothetical protein